MYFNKFIFIFVSNLLVFTFLSFTNLTRFGYSSKPVFNSLIGEKAPFNDSWEGLAKVDKSLPILVMAGHADSQGIIGSGTPGEAVAVNGYKPMNINLTDELFWNLKIVNAIVKTGKSRGLIISSYDPELRTIHDENDPRTNWSVGYQHTRRGGYAIEIHFDSYGKVGYGAGLIPALNTDLNRIDESLANTFGRFPFDFRGGLGAPQRNIRILEIGKLQGNLEKNLRTLSSRKKTINLIAGKVVQSILLGMNIQRPLNPTLQKDDTFLPAIYL